MRFGPNRRTATKIKDGRVQRKNRHRPTAHLGCVLDRESPGPGHRHVVTKRDVLAFIDLIPDWGELSERLERIVLSTRNDDCDGAYEFFHREETGAIFLHPWNEDLWIDFTREYFEAHAEVLLKIGVSHDVHESVVMCRFTEAQARAFTLLHVFMHELGHHFDRIHQKHRDSSKGEDYAERFAMSRLDQIFPEYCRVFGDPNRSE